MPRRCGRLIGCVAFASNAQLLLSRGHHHLVRMRWRTSTQSSASSIRSFASNALSVLSIYRRRMTVRQSSHVQLWKKVWLQCVRSITPYTKRKPVNSYNPSLSTSRPDQKTEKSPLCPPDNYQQRIEQKKKKKKKKTKF